MLPRSALLARCRALARPSPLARPYSNDSGRGSGGRVRELLASPVNWLIAANVGVYAAFYYYRDVLRERWAWRLYRGSFVVSNSRVFGGHPESLLGSMFMHSSPIHLLLNMTALGSFGPAVTDMLGRRGFLGLYFAAGLAGGASHLAYCRIAPQLRIPAARHVDYDTAAVGASGATSGLVAYVCARVPMATTYLFFIPVKNWIFVPLWLGYSGWSMYVGDSSIGHAAHLGGATVGLALALTRRRLRL
jgi:membrane associated rhomboid family serine protease